MKAIQSVLATLILCTSFSLFSQDLITLKDGSSIEAKVMEVADQEVMYKKWNNLEGPVYSTLKSSIQTIQYENGTVEALHANGALRQEGGIIAAQYYSNDQRVEKLDFINQLRLHPEAHEKYQSGQRIFITGGIMTIGSALAFGVTYFSNLGSGFSLGATNDKQKTAYIASGVGIVVGLGTFFIGKSKVNKALFLYNNAHATSLYFDVNQNGLGLVYTF